LPCRSQESAISTCRPSIEERLLEDPVLVADAVPHRRDRHGGQRIEEARCEAPEPPVAEPWLHLELAQLVELEVERGQRVARRRLQVGGQQRIVELSAQQVLRRQVDDRLRAPADLGLEGLDPARDEGLPHSPREAPCTGRSPWRALKSTPWPNRSSSVNSRANFSGS
jgi:hypothetical protein